MAPTILLALLMVAVATWLTFMAYHGLAGVRAERRAAWELDRAEWRQWISRP